MVHVVHGKWIEILNIIDTGIKIFEKVIAQSRSANKMKNYLKMNKQTWSTLAIQCRPRVFLACSTNLPNQNYNVIIHPITSRASNETGKVERNNDVIKKSIKNYVKATKNPLQRCWLPERLFLHIWSEGQQL